jgi:hypothetical protein
MYLGLFNQAAALAAPLTEDERRAMSGNRIALATRYGIIDCDTLRGETLRATAALAGAYEDAAAYAARIGAGLRNVLGERLGKAPRIIVCPTVAAPCGARRLPPLSACRSASRPRTARTTQAPRFLLRNSEKSAQSTSPDSGIRPDASG